MLIRTALQIDVPHITRTAGTKTSLAKGQQPLQTITMATRLLSVLRMVFPRGATYGPRANGWAEM